MSTSRVTPVGWVQSTTAEAGTSRVTPTGWRQVPAAAGGGARPRLIGGKLINSGLTLRGLV